VFGLNGGEWFIVAFVTVMVVSARYWPALAERIAVRLGGPNATHTENTSNESDVLPRE